MEGEVIDSNKAFKQAIKQNSKRLSVIFLLTFVWVIACFMFFSTETLISGGYWLFFPPLYFISTKLYSIYAKVREDFWKQLAVKYNWQYTALNDLSKEKALLFNQGHTRVASHGITGSYNNHLFHIFEYEFTVGHGKSSKTYNFTVFKVKFAGTFPHLYLNYKNDGYNNPPFSFAKISVPEEFENQFKLYSPKEYEIETLQIFTPDVFAMLLDNKWSHDMEFINGELIIYTNTRFHSFNNLDNEVEKVKRFVEILAPVLNRLKLTQIGDIPSTLS